jgi:hypothetical protein
MCPSPGLGGIPGTQAMILNHQYRFIFIKTRKTAGTSIEVALSRFCGPRDVITPISPKDEDLRRELGFRGPQNYQLGGIAGLISRLRREPEKNRRVFHNHIHAHKVRDRVPADVWSSYYKICFERNPWDKVISAYWFKHKDGSREGLTRFIMEGEAAIFSDWERYTDQQGNLIVDHVAHYESLTDELAAFSEKVGLPGIELPRAKGAIRKDRRHYSERPG